MPHSVLVIDDDPMLLSCVRRFLTTAGYVACCATDGFTGEQLAREERPDMILLDMRMPARSGLATLAALRGTSESAEVPVVMLSGSVEDLAEAKRAGADGVLLKPFRQADLLSTISPLFPATP